MAAHIESISFYETQDKNNPFIKLGRKALGGVENYFKAIAPAIDSLDLTTHVEITVPDKSFKIMNSHVHPGQLILQGLHGFGTKTEIVPKQPAVTSS